MSIKQQCIQFLFEVFCLFHPQLKREGVPQTCSMIGTKALLIGLLHHGISRLKSLIFLQLNWLYSRSIVSSPSFLVAFQTVNSTLDVICESILIQWNSFGALEAESLSFSQYQLGCTIFQLLQLVDVFLLVSYKMLLQ